MKGLLYSQIGYEPALPVRIVVRAQVGFVRAEGKAELRLDGKVVAQASVEPWGELWGSHWWTAEFPAGLKAGDYAVCVLDGGVELLAGEGLRIEAGCLWNETVEAMAADMLETRLRFAKADCGWQDAGAPWQESNAQSSMIIALTDLLELAPERLDGGLTERIRRQVAVGCDYLVKTQEEATRRGKPPGALSHDLLGHEEVILPADALKAVVAWRRSIRVLPASYDKQRVRYAKAADDCQRWLETEARPLGERGFSRRQRGLPPEAAIPADEWQTRDWVLRCWAALESWKGVRYESKGACIAAAREILARQISEEQAEAGYWGHFREYASLPHSEKAWSHSIVGGEFGTDAGGTFPHYLLPLLEMLRLWPEHEEAPQWREALERFARGYLIPACRANPFGLAPYGIFADGPIWFAGPWHGFNCIYGLTAALALELADLLGEEALVSIAYANLQWIAGLHAGVTAESIRLGSVVYRERLAPDEALPASMIYRVGRRWAGSWLGTQGVVCNGFATGEQFKFDTDPTPAADGPHAFTDEDWIPHSAGWLSGLVRLMKRLDPVR